MWRTTGGCRTSEASRSSGAGGCGMGLGMNPRNTVKNSRNRGISTVVRVGLMVKRLIYLKLNNSMDQNQQTLTCPTNHNKNWGLFLWGNFRN
jgi:hypothetical protein